jgi:hypothetical protein
MIPRKWTLGSQVGPRRGAPDWNVGDTGLAEFFYS